jgi:acetyl esterase/lipase
MSSPANVQAVRDIPYVLSTIGRDPTREFDLFFLPPDTSRPPPPLVVFVHGGAWRT